MRRLWVLVFVLLVSPLSADQGRSLTGALTFKESGEKAWKPLPGALVSLDGVKAREGFPAQQAKLVVRLDRNGFKPPIALVPRGRAVCFRNVDKVCVNLKTSSLRNPTMNICIDAGQSFTRVFKEPEIIALKDSCHPASQGSLVVMKHPYYALTDGRGRFELKAVPSGRYRLRVWHPKGSGSLYQEPEGAEGQGIWVKTRRPRLRLGEKTTTLTLRWLWHD